MEITDILAGNSASITSSLRKVLYPLLGLYVLSATPAYAQQPYRQADEGTDMGLFSPVDKPNTPVGVAKGIHPGRVAWAYDPKAAAWDGKTGLYSDPDNNSQTRVNDMMEGAIIALTNQSSIAPAWDELFKALNAKKGKGDTSYKKGEKIAIKINLNDNGGTNIIDATPQSVLALIHQLVDIMGVPQECITVYDAQRRGISAVYNYVEPIYPGVSYQNWGGFVPNAVEYSQEITNELSKSIARAAYEADYMINMALLKRHSQPTDKWKDSAGQTGITATGKNQFGSLANCSALHYSIRDWSNARGMGTYNSIVDLMSNKYFGGNTLVYIVDGMYVNPKHNGKAVKFTRAPFNDGWTSSFFASNDQVAIESVVLDFINSELPLAANADNFLHEAAMIGNPPSKTNYVGKDQVSLGVHEHWNNPDDRQYSRNLGSGYGIELFRVPLDSNRGAIESFYADRLAVDDNGKITLAWNTSNGETVLLNGTPVEKSGKMTLPVKNTTRFDLQVKNGDSVVAAQPIVVRKFKKVKNYPAKAASLQGTFSADKEGWIALSGERTKERNAATWKISAPATGDYFLCATYKGSDPVPAIIYINGKKMTENFGFLATTGNKTGKFYFPIHLEKGESTLELEIQGRRSNRLQGISILTEVK